MPTRGYLQPYTMFMLPKHVCKTFKKAYHNPSLVRLEIEPGGEGGDGRKCNFERGIRLVRTIREQDGGG